ncbi:MAG: hypothetical protein HKM93_02985 [Desulfobacteraceae bacterium]|nr:hypothetical protein [Desulfobacteraceae bacterium]
MNKSLIFGGAMSTVAAFLHIAIIIGGPDWYRFFGASPNMVLLAGQESFIPTVRTFGIFIVLFIWGLYAFSGAGLLIRLPLLKVALVIISIIYIVRGLLLFPIWIIKPEFINHLIIWSSIVCLIVGCAYAIGTRQVWIDISKK